MRRRNVVIASMLILLLSAVFVTGYIKLNEVLELAEFSVISACEPKGQEILEQNNVVVLGTTRTSVNETVNLSTATIEEIKQNIECNIAVADPTDVKTIRHEACHCSQAKGLRLASCQRPKLRYWNEVECYLKEKVPMLYNDEIKEYQERMAKMQS